MADGTVSISVRVSKNGANFLPTASVKTFDMTGVKIEQIPMSVTATLAAIDLGSLTTSTAQKIVLIFGSANTQLVQFGYDDSGFVALEEWAAGEIKVFTPVNASAPFLKSVSGTQTVYVGVIQD